MNSEKSISSACTPDGETLPVEAAQGAQHDMTARGLLKEAACNFAASVAFVGGLTGAISSERVENILVRLDQYATPSQPSES